MAIDLHSGTQSVRQPYRQPLLTQHEPLHALTGKSGEKNPTTDKTTDKDSTSDKVPGEKSDEGKSGT